MLRGRRRREKAYGASRHLQPIVRSLYRTLLACVSQLSAEDTRKQSFSILIDLRAALGYIDPFSPLIPLLSVLYASCAHAI